MTLPIAPKSPASSTHSGPRPFAWISFQPASGMMISEGRGTAADSIAIMTMTPGQPIAL